MKAASTVSSKAAAALVLLNAVRNKDGNDAVSDEALSLVANNLMPNNNDFKGYDGPFVFPLELVETQGSTQAEHYQYWRDLFIRDSAEHKDMPDFRKGMLWICSAADYVRPDHNSVSQTLAHALMKTADWYLGVSSAAPPDSQTLKNVSHLGGWFADYLYTEMRCRSGAALKGYSVVKNNTYYGMADLLFFQACSENYDDEVYAKITTSKHSAANPMEFIGDVIECVFGVLWVNFQAAEIMKLISLAIDFSNWTRCSDDPRQYE